MNISKLFSILKGDQRGFTLVEMIVGVAIISAISGAAATSITQMNDTVINNRNQLSTISQVQNAGHWIQVDTKTAQKIEVDPGETGLPVKLTRIDWNSTMHEITYEAVNNQLLRHYAVNGVATSTIVIARSIIANPQSTNCQFVDTDPIPDGIGDELVFTVTTTKGVNSYEQTETRVFKFESRSD